MIYAATTACTHHASVRTQRVHGEKAANEGRGTNRYTHTLSIVTHTLPVRASRRAVVAVVVVVVVEA